MSDYKFTQNYRDLCKERGVDAGFQFEFYCERCRDTWRTTFKPYRTGQVSGWVNQISGLLFSIGLGRITYGTGRAADGFAQAGFSTARDAEFQEAIGEAEKHFYRCAKCNQHVCQKCWDNAHGLCLHCAPDVKIEVEVARRQGEVESATTRAHEDGMGRGGQVEVTVEQQLVCPKCNAQTRGAKFCPECGEALSVQSCGKCRAPLLPGAKFCGECGTEASK